MQSVKYCSGEPVTIQADAPVSDAARRMRAEGVGCLVVLDETESVVGMITDRDLALRVVARSTSQGGERVRQVMSAPAVEIDAGDSLERACSTMRARGIRRLPVTTEGRLVGLLALDDVFGVLAQGLEDLRWQRLEKRRRQCKVSGPPGSSLGKEYDGRADD